MLPKYDNLRLMFPKGEQTKFLELVLQKSGRNTTGLAEIAGVSPRTINDWKREKYNISEKTFDIFCKKFKINPTFRKDIYLNKWMQERLKLCRKGGLASFKKYGNPSTPEGRKKGGSKTLAILRQKGIIAPCKNFSLPTSKSCDLAEFVGIMLGDGGLTKQQATITLNTDADRDYIEFVSKLGTKLFRDKPTILERKDCRATNLILSGINLVEYLVDTGLEIGDKVKHQVKVPGWIQDSRSYKLACLRGLMDTDGCMAKCNHKYKLKIYTYHNPCFANRSKPILEFVANTLTKIGLHPCVTGERIWLYNKPEVRAYFEHVGSSNTRLLRFKEESPSGRWQRVANPRLARDT